MSDDGDDDDDDDDDDDNDDDDDGDNDDDGGDNALLCHTLLRFAVLCCACCPLHTATNVVAVSLCSWLCSCWWCWVGLGWAVMPVSGVMRGRECNGMQR